ncbi:hypothetical protein CR513_22581, partial [Mucuna pruriens]
MWDIVENGNYIPTKEDETEIPRSSRNEDQKIRYLLNSNARKFLMYDLGHISSSLGGDVTGKGLQDKYACTSV